MSIESLINDFSFLDGWEDRYKYLIELGGQLPRFSDEQKKRRMESSRLPIPGLDYPSL